MIIQPNLSQVALKLLAHVQDQEPPPELPEGYRDFLDEFDWLFCDEFSTESLAEFYQTKNYTQWMENPLPKLYAPCLKAIAEIRNFDRPLITKSLLLLNLVSVLEKIIPRLSKDELQMKLGSSQEPLVTHLTELIGEFQDEDDGKAHQQVIIELKKLLPPLMLRSESMGLREHFRRSSSSSDSFHRGNSDNGQKPLEDSRRNSRVSLEGLEEDPFS